MLKAVPPTDCMQAREAISARLDGELLELDEARLDAHLRDCDACREFAEEAGEVVARLRGAELEPVPSVLFAPRRRARSGAGAVAAVALLAAVVGSSFMLGTLLAPHAGPRTATGPSSVRPSGPGVEPSSVIAAIPQHRVEPGRLIPL